MYNRELEHLFLRMRELTPTYVFFCSSPFGCVIGKSCVAIYISASQSMWLKAKSQISQDFPGLNF